jgi:hypothetical protein
MAVVVCVTGYCGGLGFAEEDSVAKLYRSLDGGVTWQEWADWPRDYFVVGFAEEGLLAGYQVVIQPKPDEAPTTPAPEARPVFAYSLMPEGTAVKSAADAATPMITDGGQVLWALEGQLLDADGQRVLSLGNPAAVMRGIRGDVKTGLLVMWSGTNYSAENYVSRYEGPSHVWTVEATFGLASLGPLDAKGGVQYGNIDFAQSGVRQPVSDYFGIVPAQIDYGGLTVRAIASPFLDEAFVLPNARNRVIAVQRGPFARVVGTGSCLNVRESYALTSAVVECVANGVLLQHQDALVPNSDADGYSWLEVFTPSGTHGFVVTDYVEY